MAFMDSLDLDTSRSKASRVRSWYLLEQYKSLEKHHLDAAQKLRDRSYQDSILLRELSERKARRRVYDQIGLCQSETHLERSLTNIKKQNFIDIDNTTYRSYYGSQTADEEDEGAFKVLKTQVAYESISVDDSKLEYPCDEVIDFSITSNHKHDENYTEDFSSVIEIVEPHEAPNDEREWVRRDLTENLGLQLEIALKNIEAIEKLAMLNKPEGFSDIRCYDMVDTPTSVLTEPSYFGSEKNSIYETEKVVRRNDNFFTIWTGLVSYACQMMQLNHGNCCSDYSSQILTAVLAFDILRRSVCSICNILQPYVSPISQPIESNVCDVLVKEEKTKHGKRNKFSKTTSKKNKMCRHPYPESQKKRRNKRRVKRNEKCSDYTNNKVNQDIQYNTRKEAAYGKPSKKTPNKHKEHRVYYEKHICCRNCRCCCTYHSREVTNPMLKVVDFIDKLDMAGNYHR